MASPSHELSLDCKPHSSYSMLLKSFGEQQQQQEQTNKNNNIEDFLSRLEEERVKIDAFKRELPLCMQLLTNAMEASRQQLQAQKENHHHQGSNRPVLEEFIPLKNISNETTTNNKTSATTDKANWMTNALLWNPTSDQNNSQIITIPKDNQTDHINGFNVISPKLGLDSTNNNKLQRNNNGGAFLPFSKDRSNNNNNRNLVPELALANSNSSDQKLEMEIENNKCNEIDNNNNNNSGGVVVMMEQQGKDGQSGNNGGAAANTSAHRKARRCWSPDLHRRFVSALQMLGGSQVATPKQIRELMKVDGLTNDEVKSHLQKYRLHTRRPSPSPQTAGSPAPQLVVLGGIWVPPEYATAAAAAHNGGPTLYGTHHHSNPTHFCPSPMPQDFYTTAALPPPPPNHHHAAFHHQLHMFKAASRVQSSPESDMRGAGDRSESIEDGKSESSSWKAGESGDNNGGERKGLAALRDDGEQESNGSEITLKF